VLVGLAVVQSSAGARCDSFLLSGLRGVGPVGWWLSLFRNVGPPIVGGLLLTGAWGGLLTRPAGCSIGIIERGAVG
jgi:hypothetical protein